MWREAPLRQSPGLLPSLQFGLISAKDTTVCPAEGEELKESFLSAFPMTCLVLAQILLLEGHKMERGLSPAPLLEQTWRRGMVLPAPSQA